jgi:hypothetical protein
MTKPIIPAPSDIIATPPAIKSLIFLTFSFLLGKNRSKNLSIAVLNNSKEKTPVIKIKQINHSVLEILKKKPPIIATTDIIDMMVKFFSIPKQNLIPSQAYLTLFRIDLIREIMGFYLILAERARFELAVPFPAQQFSRLSPSTTQTPLQ